MPRYNIYEDENILVVCNDNSDNYEYLIITFTPLMVKEDTAHQWENGFAENMLNSASINNFCFISKWNHWWELPSFYNAIEKIKKDSLYLNSKRISLYGSSMGGYGALKSCNILESDYILAIAPQVDIFSSIESRWRPYISRLRPIGDFPVIETSIYKGRIDIVYDPLEPDRKHVDITSTKVNKIKAPGTGHFPLKLMQYGGDLPKKILDILTERERASHIIDSAISTIIRDVINSKV
ncbi:hypothetical protein [Aeromonas veronii]|uniref:hypothetical protein n=1 Tax=Aeromonas veronii TaxID=654 RepID=UPI0038B6027B